MIKWFLFVLYSVLLCLTTTIIALGGSKPLITVLVLAWLVSLFGTIGGIIEDE